MFLSVSMECITLLYINLIFNFLVLVDAVFFWSPSVTEINLNVSLDSLQWTSVTDIACPIGYTGSTCKGPCQYPKYGFMCQSKCDCNPQLCHHITGCPPPRLTCKAGRSGKYCEFPCRYPSYGQGCQEKCSCLQHLCNAETGCKYKISTEGKPNIALSHVYTKPSANSQFVPKRSIMEDHLSTNRNDKTNDIEHLTSTESSINISKARGKTEFALQAFGTQRQAMLWGIIGLAMMIFILVLLHTRIQVAMRDKKKKKHIFYE